MNRHSLKQRLVLITLAALASTTTFALIGPGTVGRQRSGLTRARHEADRR